MPPRKFRPEGYTITVECQVVQSKESGGLVSIPMCAWGDDNTAAMIGVIRPETLLKDPKSIDLAAVAEETAEIREEIRRPIG
ncbi:hypothetical protein DER30_2020 [Streptomyces sp. HB202]|nr:hypothetical protein DER30_2020 [Streptomyces sp. HB202]